MHTNVKDLPASIQATLRSLDYSKRDIEVKIQDAVSLLCTGSDGRKGFATVLNLSTGQSETLEGSWGGANLFVGSIATDGDVLRAAMAGVDAVVIATSATPKMVGPPPKEGERPQFGYPAGGLPELVDWVGQRATIDAAKAAGVKHVVVIGSRGGTDPNHMLNRIGGEGTNIMVWKRKA